MYLSIYRIQVLRVIYFFFTILQYGTSAWSGMGIVASNKILRAQKSTIKMILNNPITYRIQLFEELHL